MQKRQFLAALLCAACLIGAGGRTVMAETRAFDIRVVAGKVVGARVIRVTKGDTVRLHWRVDKAMALHLHGYDIEFGVAAGASTSKPFDAFATGRFPFTSHGAGHGHQALMYLEVHPD